MRRIVETATVLVWVLVALSGSAPAQEATEQRAIAVIRRVGGKVTLDKQAPSRPVVAVDLAGREVTDDALAALKDLPSLRRLNLGFTRVTDGGIERLKGCVRLEVLLLFGCFQVTDMGVAHLKALTRLRHLDLSHTNVTDKGLEQLHGLVGLRHLGLQGVHLGKKEEQRLRRALPKIEVEQGNGNTA
jgi:internalin A